MQLIYLVRTDPSGKITSIAYDLVDEDGQVFNADFEIGYNRRKEEFTLAYALQTFAECFQQGMEAIPVAPEHYAYIYQAFSYVKGGRELRAKFLKMNHRAVKPKAA